MQWSFFISDQSCTLDYAWKMTKMRAGLQFKKKSIIVTFKLKSLPWQYLGSNNALRFSKNDCIFTLHNSSWSSSNQMCLVYSRYPNNFVDPAIFSFGLYCFVHPIFRFLFWVTFGNEVTKISCTVMSRAVDRSTNQFSTIFGVLLTEMCYYVTETCYYSIIHFPVRWLCTYVSYSIKLSCQIGY